MLSNGAVAGNVASGPAQALASMLKEGIDKDPQAPLVFWSDGQETTISAGQIWQRAGRLVAGLESLGLAPGDRIAIQVPNNLDGVTAFLAGTRLGLEIVPLVMNYGAHELRFIIRQANAKAFICPASVKGVELAERIALLDDIACIRHIIVVGGHGDDNRVVAFEEMLETPDATLDVPDAALTDIFAIIYTSGTTGGEPKGAIHTHESFSRELQADAEIWIPTGEHRAPLVIFPPGHIAGVAYALMPIIDGSGAVYMDAWSAEAAASLIERHALSWSFGTPFHLTTLLEAAAPGQLNSLRMFGCGGASVPPSLIERADAAGVPAFRAYGSTEHPSVSSGRRDDPLRVRAYTDGRPMPGVTIKILDDQNRSCGIGEVGEIVTRGPELFRGYLDGRHDKDALQDGWYRTGDLGKIDEDAALTIVDRKKDIVIRGGENISSKEVEDIILQIADVSAVAVVGWPDARYGERVAAFVQMKGGKCLDLDTVTQHFRNSRIARHKTPERLVDVDEFERSAAGKILKVPLRDRAARLAADELS